MPTANAKPRQRRKEARPAEVSAAALELFVEKGFAATRLDDIAARTGVSKGTLYLYFDNKEALFEAVIREGVLPLVDRDEAMVASHHGSAFELLRQILSGWWEALVSTSLSGISKLMISEARNFPEVAAFYHQSVIRRLRSMIATVLERGVASGEFRPVDIEACVSVAVAPMLMLVVWKHSLEICIAPTDPQRTLATHLDLLRAGLLTRQAYNS